MGTVLILDAGNTKLKLAFYQDDCLKADYRIEGFNLVEIQQILSKYSIDNALLSSVRNEKETKQISALIPNCQNLKQLKIPIDLDYRSKQSLGADRIANAVAISNKTAGNKLAIDIGTCIKFDFVDDKNVYRGGSISPGIQLRYKSMNDYTGALPRLDLKSSVQLIGQNTIDCMHSGVINGIKGELDYFIQQYETKYSDLTIFMTGGDAKHFDYSSKNNIFALENLTMEGLYLILKANAK